MLLVLNSKLRILRKERAVGLNALFYPDTYKVRKNHNFASSELSSLELSLQVSSIIAVKFTLVLILNSKIQS